MTLYDIIHTTPSPDVSDFHVAVGRAPTFRISGRLESVEGYDGVVTPEKSLEFIQQLLTPSQLDFLKEHGEIDVSLSAFGSLRCRTNIYRQRGSYSLAFRLTPSQAPNFHNLGLPDNIVNLCGLSRGLVIIAGPTGTGKTTTLAAMVDWINQNRQCHVITLEDPIEYAFSHGESIINQREIGSDTRSFHTALRSALRQDPDVIMVGEMRDLETISTVLTAAETGHLVLSTLHTVGAAKTIDRIVDVFPANQQQQVRVQLSMVLQGIVCQQLIPSTLHQGKRELATEVLLPNGAIRNHIRKGSIQQITNTVQTGLANNMHTMDSSLIQLHQEGKISREDVLVYSVDPELAQKQLTEKGL